MKTIKDAQIVRRIVEYEDESGTQFWHLIYRDKKGNHYVSHFSTLKGRCHYCGKLIGQHKHKCGGKKVIIDRGIMMIPAKMIPAKKIFK